MYSRLDKYLQQQGFKRGIVDSNIYINIEGENYLIVVVYVNDIIFRGSSNKMCQDFVKDTKKEFEMSMLNNFSLFIILQISQSNKGIFISQIKYIKKILKKIEW